jgi:hypothetical protein
MGPFNPITKFTYTIEETGHVSLCIYNLKGQKVKTLVDEEQEPGSHDVRLDGSDLLSGVYLYILRSGSSEQRKKLVLIK